MTLTGEFSLLPDYPEVLLLAALVPAPENTERWVQDLNTVTLPDLAV